MSTNYRVEFEFKRSDEKVIDETEADTLKNILGQHGVTVEDGASMGCYWAWWGHTQTCGGQSCEDKHNDIYNNLPDCCLMHSDWWFDEHPPDESFSSDGWDEEETTP